MDGFGQSLDSASPSAPSPLEALFRRHYHWLAAALRRRYGPEAAEDLVQETYLKLAKGQRAQDIRHPRALLMQIARNAATDHHRRTRREITTDAAPPDLESASSEPLQQRALLLKQIVLALPPKLRDVFVLSLVEGLTHQEIARLLGISVKTVEWRMRKALAHCAATMRD